MKTILTYIAILSVGLAFAQVSPTVTENYVHSTSYKTAVQESALGSVSDNDKIETVAYYDGLGRPKQTIAIRQGGKNGTGDDMDMVAPVAYDVYGRQVKEYLPLPVNATDGKFRTNAITELQSYYYSNYTADFSGMTATTANPYAEKALEDSPLNRVLQQEAPGKDWQQGNGHEISFEYRANIANEVKRYKVTLAKTSSSNVVTYIPTLSLDGSYPANELFKTITYDENYTSGTDHSIEEFKDKQGRVILKRTYNNSIAHDTYYVYGPHGNLSYVLPPKAEPDTALPDATELSELCYQYVYDDRNRLVEKKIPGKGWESIIYDKLDRPVITRDANLEAEGKWLFTAYDAFGRVSYTGKVYRPTWHRSIMQNHVNTGSYLQSVNKLGTATSINGVTIYYPKCFTNVTYISESDIEVLTINYYDDYNFDKYGLSLPSSNYYSKAIENYNNANTLKTRGLPTGSKVRTLGTSNWTTTITGYDEHQRPIWIGSKNAYHGTEDYVESKLGDITGWVEETRTRHIRSGSTLTTIDKYTYDHSGKVLSHTNTINGGAEESIAVNEYDNLGQLTRKKVGGTGANELQVVDYSYNIRGWLKGINDVANLGSDDLFGYKINYNDPIEGNGGGSSLYNGNICQTIWKTKNDNEKRGYSYAYDALNRLTTAYGRKGSSLTTNNNTSMWAMYDTNGNLTRLFRSGHLVATPVEGTTGHFGTMDDLVYTYESKSNKLKKVLDNGNDNYGFIDGSNITTEYTYDANGNMLRDYNKSISSNIAYNHLNLPTNVPINGGNISYIYDAVGTKLKKTTSTGTTTEYAGNYVYENGSLKFFNHAEGYVDVNSVTNPFTGTTTTTFGYVYQYKDHLGNVRLSYMDSNRDGSIAISEILEENNYYPFGLKHKGYNAVINNSNPALDYKYNGVELEETLGLYLYEMDFRQYDPAIARFTGIDPVTHFSNSTYNAFDNNPVFWADPSGADAITYRGGIAWSQKDLANSIENGFGNSKTQSHQSENNSVYDIGRNKDGEIIYITDGRRETVEHFHGESAIAEIGYIFTNDGTPIQVYKFISGHRGFKTDCHGLTFADGDYWINNEEVRKILNGDDYDNIDDGSIKVGDVVTQEDSRDNIHHSSTVSCTDGTCKYSTSIGIGGVQVETIDRPIEETEKIMERATRIDLRNKFYRKLATDKVFSTEEINKLRQKVYPKKP